MLDHGGQRHGKGFGDLTHHEPVVGREAGNDGAPGWVAQGRKDFIKHIANDNHQVSIVNCQTQLGTWRAVNSRETKMSNAQHEAPQRNQKHQALQVFAGTWRHSGKSYGSEAQSADDPKGKPDAWTGSSTARWITGEFFLVQDETATIGKDPFHMVSVMGLDPQTDAYFVRAFSHLGFYRRYQLEQQGKAWVLSGDSERAGFEFSADGNTQDIRWEWFREGRWLPLCDRKAVKAE